ncbi:MAG: glutamate--tRNA ligase [Desulfurococcaceae archaeon]
MKEQEKSLLEKVREVAYKHALANAIKYGGKADFKAVISKVIGEIPEIRGNIRQYLDIIKNVIEGVNKLGYEDQVRIAKENWPELLEERSQVYEKTLPPLPNAVEGKFVTRFAPNPDYTIHLGNARPALLCYWYSDMYKGKFILRFEDTDPRIKSPYPEAYLDIKDSLKLLGISWDEEYIQSLRLEIFYDIAKKLIERGGAYVDKCDSKSFRSFRNAGKSCPHRELPIEIHLDEFDKMLEGHYNEEEAVLRIKTDLNHPDISVRDWVAFRIIDTTKTPHPVVGEKYIVWPTYNFAAGVDDYLMGVTHILRAKEHLTNTVKQKYLYDHMNWRYPETVHFGRLSLEGVVLSKSKMRKMMQESEVEAYSDPRLGTIKGLMRKGIVKETIWKIIKDVNIKQVDAKISLVNLYAINRTIVDPIANRYMAVHDPIPLIINDLPRELEALIPIHPSRKETYKYIIFDNSILYISSNDLELVRTRVFRLMGLGNFVITDIKVINNRPIFVIKLHSLTQEEARKVNAPVIQWVPDNEKVHGALLIPQGTELVNRSILIESRILNEKIGSIIQLYRIGFARIDQVNKNNVALIYTHD